MCGTPDGEDVKYLEQANSWLAVFHTDHSSLENQLGQAQAVTLSVLS